MLPPSRVAGNAARLQEGARHYYDLHQLLGVGDVVDSLGDGRIGDLARDVDEKSEEYGWPFTPRPLAGYAQSPAFDPESSIAPIARAAYDATVAALVYGTPPTFEECVSRVSLAHEIL